MHFFFQKCDQLSTLSLGIKLYRSLLLPPHGHFSLLNISHVQRTFVRWQESCRLNTVNLTLLTLRTRPTPIMSNYSSTLWTWSASQKTLSPVRMLFNIVCSTTSPRLPSLTDILNARSCVKLLATVTISQFSNLHDTVLLYYYAPTLIMSVVWMLYISIVPMTTWSWFSWHI